MAYRDHLVALSERSERQVLAAYNAWLSGALSRDECIQYIASAIAVSNGQADALARMAYASELMTQLGTPAPVVSSVRPDDLDRLTKAAGTVLDVAEASAVSQTIVARLARCEPLETAAKSYSDSMIRSGKTKGWVRQKSAKACQLCTWWWREGRVWPAEHPFQHHKGCTCTPKPVIAEGIKETWKTAREKGIR
ncbi:hypothetical protein [Gordonia sp. NB41Y]|uniref:hypothetical protein n=1 Tax=Gordonia sp. NB41Y TaxID=875808 RepID=UPI0002BE1F99|nr:hypothetical protein [Gordonia sp. NB41Y]EMP09850.1 hypothetical protein ISGA_3984 [Gordonia sp. NB41Y]WLP90082.1 hypothetical protein Q9K23_21565 [Gordonia sp. NB41Y]